MAVPPTKASDLGPSLVSGMPFMPRHAAKVYTGFGRTKFEGQKFWKCWEERNWGFWFSLEGFCEKTQVLWLCLDSTFPDFGCRKCENKMRNLCCLTCFIVVIILKDLENKAVTLIVTITSSFLGFYIFYSGHIKLYSWRNWNCNGILASKKVRKEGIQKFVAAFLYLWKFLTFRNCILKFNLN